MYSCDAYLLLKYYQIFIIFIIKCWKVFAAKWSNKTWYISGFFKEYKVQKNSINLKEI